jgi:thiol-disulfide isomerase/thioredoxin
VDSFIIGVQLLLAGVFAFAGVAKLFDLPGSRRAMVDFGVPERAAPLAGLLLPLAELATAAALVLNPSARWGAIAALALLLAFSGGIANAMVRGRAPDCNCFGQVHSAPVGPWTLARNAVLAGLALILVLRGPGPAIDDWVADRTAAELVAIGAALAALALAALSIQLRSENRKLRRDAAATPAEVPEPRELPKVEPEGLPVGTTAPNFTLADMMRGGTRTLESLLARGRPVVVQFIDPTCGPCERLLPAVARWQSALAERLTIAVVTSGSADDRPKWEEEGFGASELLLDESNEVFNAFRVRSMPTAIGISVDGTVASAPAGGLHMPEVLCRLMIRREAADDGEASTASGAPGVLPDEPPVT